MPVVFILALLTVASSLAQDDMEKYSQMSLEELMNVKVVTASLFEENIENAPASVVVITDKQIRENGYRDLA